MAHYAFVDADNVVVEVIAGRDEGQGVDWEAYYSEQRGLRCLRTSYHARDGVNIRTGGPAFRRNYAGIGYRFDPGIGPDGAFVQPETS
ncbi:MAG: hypothetical protein EBZ59_05695 [Planctomycetia bacterium]|nr:hypothetical protein [Planctomycetia bacterium]